MTARTVILDGILLEVKFNHYPAEPANREYPGCPEEYEILSVYYADAVRKDISGLFANGDTMDRIVKELEKIKGEM